MTKIWQTKEWREKRITFLEGKVCFFCGKPATTIHHPTYLNSDGSSISNEQYLDWENVKVFPLCRGCHLNYHKGFLLCRKCGKHWHRPKYTTCWHCFEKTEEGETKIKAMINARDETPVINIINPLCQKIQYIKIPSLDDLKLELSWIPSQFFMCHECEDFPCEKFIEWNNLDEKVYTKLSLCAEDEE